MGLRRNYIFSSAGAAKLTTVVVGIIVVAIGMRSHFQSAWVQYDLFKNCHLMPNAPCPDIAMERFYIAVIVICTFLSVIGLLLCMGLVNPFNTLFWVLDIAYHALSSSILFVGAILHIVSAIKIDQHSKITGGDSSFLLHDDVVKINDTEVFLGTQKIIAGILTIFESFLYIVTMILIKRSRSRNLQFDSTSDNHCVIVE